MHEALFPVRQYVAWSNALLPGKASYRSRLFRQIDLAESCTRDGGDRQKRRQSGRAACGKRQAQHTHQDLSDQVSDNVSGIGMMHTIAKGQIKHAGKIRPSAAFWYCPSAVATGPLRKIDHSRTQSWTGFMRSGLSQQISQ
jgi:hypothetical protein